MRDIDKIIIHCSATPKGKHFSTDTIKKWHLERGWSDIGYHYVVELDGSLKLGRQIDKIGAHCKGHNKNSIGVCYVGGCDENMKAEDTRTNLQKRTLNILLKYLTNLFPKAKVFGHNDFSSKDCPSFNAKEEYKTIKCTC